MIWIWLYTFRQSIFCFWHNLKEHVLKYKKNPTLGSKSEKQPLKSLFGNSSNSDEFHDFFTFFLKINNFFNFTPISKWIAVSCLREQSPYRKIFKKSRPPPILGGGEPVNFHINNFLGVSWEFRGSRPPLCIYIYIF